tara:strand:+ start:1085 stop:1351 length:267 start_codon:yes stop_codon:yes gene_type:complete
MSWSLNKEKAIEQFLNVYRIKRNKKFVELDIQFIKALETDDLITKQSVIETKNALRDFPLSITHKSFETVDELRSKWPLELMDLPNVW